MTACLHPFETKTLGFIHTHRLVEPAQVLGVAVSGGPDSVALLRVLSALKTSLSIETLVVLHYDHGLRGEDSTADRLFVEHLAGRLGCELIVGCGDVRQFQKDRRISVEMAARQCRRDFFMDVLTRGRVDRLALGHTADDQAEEVLMRLCRGTGPAGMKGMRPATPEGFVRPLLWAGRQDIVRYLTEENMPFREDASNQEGFCQRNRLRREVLPLLEEIFHPGVRRTLWRHAEVAAQEESYWDRQIDNVWARVVRSQHEDTVVLDAQEMVSLHEALSVRVFRRALEDLGLPVGIFAVHLKSLERLLRGFPSGRQVVLPRGLRAVRESGRIVLTRRPEEPLPRVRRTIAAPGCFGVPALRGKIRIERKDFPGGTPSPRDPGTAVVDAEKVLWPLAVRTFEPGDRFYPLGGPGSKKLQDFFTDAKVPRSVRGRVPLICDREKICWVVGYRLDDRVKVTDQTRTVLEIQWTPLD